MSDAGNPRDGLVEAVLRATRKLGSEAALFSQAVAERLGLAATDVECLEILADEGRLTVGRLAELTGLTTGSATRMVDRLEQAGFVRRVADPADRRRVLVEPVPGVQTKLANLHGSIHDAQVAVIAAYDDVALETIAGFLERSVGVTHDEAIRMRGPSEEVGAGGSYAAPVGAVTEGQLVFVSGAPNVTIRGEADLSELYRARFDGPVPRMRVRGGVVTVAYPRFGWFDWRAHLGDMNLDASVHWRKDRGEILLNAAVPWSVELRGGVSRLQADLRRLRLRSVEVRGGASRIELQLPRPAGVVPIRIAGGTSDVSIHRPAGTAAVVELHGGVSKITVDGERFASAGQLSLKSPGASASSDRYEIDVSGGANRIAIDAR